MRLSIYGQYFLAFSSGNGSPFCPLPGTVRRADPSAVVRADPRANGRAFTSANHDATPDAAPIATPNEIFSSDDFALSDTSANGFLRLRNVCERRSRVYKV